MHLTNLSSLLISIYQLERRVHPLTTAVLALYFWMTSIMLKTKKEGGIRRKRHLNLSYQLLKTHLK